MLSNKKLEPIVTFYQKQENEHFACFYYEVLKILGKILLITLL